MKPALGRSLRALKAARQLGPTQVFWYAVYQLGLRTGHYRRVTPPGLYRPLDIPVRPLFPLPDGTRLRSIPGSQASSIIEEAEEITSGQVRLFGGPPAALRLTPPDAQLHWTAYEGNPLRWGVEDIKLIWEPARFGWVYTLGRAYRLTGDEKYPTAFWRHFKDFLKANPPNMGPNWASAQEVALRLLAWLFAASVFWDSPESTPARQSLLAGAVVEHARRIPPTMVYARAQNNNHLITEALGLYAASFALPDHPEAARWRAAGWRWLQRAFLAQLEPDGTYAQHSMNYHRLMLHAALQALLPGQHFPEPVAIRLAAAARWLIAQVDPLSGRAPNLGANDGANILPLSAGLFLDQRPVAQAAARAFFGQPAFPPGPWDELSLWLGLPVDAKPPLEPLPASPAVHRVGDQHSWATIRAVQFRGRPSHADQLHVDLWWRGENIALDAGTYRYTSPAPWDNALAQTLVHNTIEVNGQNQMHRAGRFLWLDWAQAALSNPSGPADTSITAEHYGYRRIGVLHRRTLVRESPNLWKVIDQLFPSDASAPENYQVRLHWLLPDWGYQMEESRISLAFPGGGIVTLQFNVKENGSEKFLPLDLALIRAGENLYGHQTVNPVLGWFSPTYNVRVPALSLVLSIHSHLPLQIQTRWDLISAEIQG